MYFFIKETEKLILITLMHENTPHFIIFPFFKPLAGLLPFLSPYGAAPDLNDDHYWDIPEV